MIQLFSIGTAETDFAVVKEHIKQQGSVDVLSLKSYLIGPSRVGKTTTRRRLTGEIEPLVTVQRVQRLSRFLAQASTKGTISFDSTAVQCRCWEIHCLYCSLSISKYMAESGTKGTISDTLQPFYILNQPFSSINEVTASSPSCNAVAEIVELKVEGILLRI